jgi:flagellar biosynthesis protein FlhF
MIIKKYVVSDMREALVRAKYELGEEAVIVSQRMVKTGKWYNVFQKKELEVTVAIEESKKQDSAKDKDNNEKSNNEKNSDKNNELPRTTTNNTDSDFSLSEAIESDPFYRNSSDKIKEQLINYCKLHDKNDHYLTLEEKKDFFKIVLKKTSFDEKVNLSKINVLVGPTGVGKTTTIAKMAAREYLINKKKVGLITIDTYRIGAIEQLKTYANILSIPFEIANEPSEMLAKLELLKDCDIILIDTLGTSPKDMGKIEEIKKHLETINGQINTYLVFSISTDKDTMMSILDKYKSLEYDALIITKLDEVSNISNLWYFLENYSSPIQFFCHGQDVPDDIQVATLDNIFDYCEENFQYDRSSK